MKKNTSLKLFSLQTNAMVSRECSRYFKALVLLGTFLSLYRDVSSQSLGIGYCPEVQVKQNFDFDSYANRWWYEYARYINFFQLCDTCAKSQYYRIEKRSLIKILTNENDGTKAEDTLDESYPFGVKYENIFDMVFVKQPESVSGKARFLNPALKEAKLHLNLNNIYGNYYILDTDYKTYSLAWTCADFFGLFHLKYFWILTSEQIPSKETVEKINQEIEKRSYISDYSISKIKQINCGN